MHFHLSKSQPDSAAEALSKFSDHLVPWLRNSGDMSSDDNRIMGMIADWYRIFGDDEEVMSKGTPGG